jgi:hypothetical protein
MEITGKVTKILPLQTGEGRNGSWKKQEFIVETAGQYPKQICMSAWGDRIDQFALTEGEVVTVSIDLESREYNGRWYTDVRAWRVARDQPGGEAPSPGREEEPPPPDSEDDGDLPF